MQEQVSELFFLELSRVEAARLELVALRRVLKALTV